MQKLKKYFKTDFTSDLKAGFITAIVALPLAIAFAIASGVEPIMGMYTAIIAGIIGAIFGGSKFSITGPTGAMAVIILSTVQKFGIEGLLVAGFLSGLFLLLFSYLKLGIVLKFIPFPVVSGFTAGIGLLIFLGQVPNFLGQTITANGSTVENILFAFENLSTVNLLAILIGIVTILILIFFPKIINNIKFLKNIPASIIALIVSIILVVYLNSVPTVSSMTTGSILPKLFIINFQLILNVLPAAITIALLGAIESLLCASVCDSMTNTKHNSNKELFGQGLANLVVPFFGGIPATAAIARSAVNIKEGARTKYAAVYHSIILLLILLFFGGLATYIPKAFLAGVLMVVSFKMINITEAKTIFRLSRLEIIVYLVTLTLTVVTDLVIAIQVGMVLAMLLLFLRLINVTNITNLDNYDKDSEYRKIIDKDKYLKGNIQIYTIYGPLFFGVINLFESKIDEHLKMHNQIIILRLKFVNFIDATGLERLKTFLIDRKENFKSTVLVTSINPQVKKLISQDKELKELISEKNTFIKTKDALEYAKKILKEKEKK